MALKLVALPAGAQKELASKLQEFLAVHLATDDQKNAHVQSSDLTMEAPHRVYTLGLKDVLRDDPLANPKSDAWRVLIYSDGKPLAAAEVATASDGSDTLTHVNRGPFVEGTAAALRGAAEMPTKYEANLLAVPALYVMALWLRAPKESQIVPIAPSPEGLAAGRSYSEQEFFHAIRPLAQERLKFDDRPQTRPRAEPMA